MLLLCGNSKSVYMISSFHGLSREQAKIIFDMAISATDFLKTSNGNHALLQETLRQHQAVVGFDKN